MSTGQIVSGLVWIAYPALIFFGLHVLEPRYVAALLAASLILRRRREATLFLSGLSRVDIAVLAALLAVVGTAVVTNSEALLRLYPAAVNLGMLLLFGLSLRYPPSMVERIARMREPNLPKAVVRYTRRVTLVWCAFFVANGTLAAYTALYSSRGLWALYNGLIAYLLMGALFVSEWLFRRHFVARHA